MFRQVFLWVFECQCLDYNRIKYFRFSGEFVVASFVFAS